ncbi:hypothetical protein D3C86_746610 [compost metagenome]
MQRIKLPPSSLKKTLPVASSAVTLNGVSSLRIRPFVPSPLFPRSPVPTTVSSAPSYVNRRIRWFAESVMYVSPRMTTMSVGALSMPWCPKAASRNPGVPLPATVQT